MLGASGFTILTIPKKNPPQLPKLFEIASLHFDSQKNDLDQKKSKKKPARRLLRVSYFALFVKSHLCDRRPLTLFANVVFCQV